MKRKFFGLLGVILMGVAMLALAPVNGAYAEGEGGAPSTCQGNKMVGNTFLGFKAWYEGLDCENIDGKAVLKGPTKGSVDKEGTSLARYVWTIVLNVSFDLSLAIGYIATAMVIYGGYLYIMSNGDPGKAMKGQKTLTTAIIGVIIAMGATVIVNTILFILGTNGGASINGVDKAFDTERLKNVFSWAYSMAGLVAVIFMVKGGVDYTISRGDPGRIQKATHGLIYAAIGLVVVILAAVITNFIISGVGGALE